jgi:His-Xaa-Ser system radical SAM maturase HxsC
MYLHALGAATNMAGSIIGRITSVPVADTATRRDLIAFGSLEALSRFGDDWEGYAGVVSPDRIRGTPPSIPSVFGVTNVAYLDDGDVVALRPAGLVKVLYRRSSMHNTIVATERCNSFCLMCSQPPRPDDDSYRIAEILRLIELIEPGAPELVLSGGEPTLLADGFFEIVQKLAENHPSTALHVLTNGRTFRDRSMAERLGAIAHPDLMLGIPLYSDLDCQHDYVVQAEGAFAETVQGLFNLAMVGVRIELRVVLHQQTIPRLPELAEFIYRNLPFVEHVALMGLEMFGFTPRNLDVLWIDPVDYADTLRQATHALALRGMYVSIYNHQLCTLPRSVWPFARKSISDWKNLYLDACAGCGARAFCGGFFQSATKRHSRGIQPLPELSAQAAAAMRELQAPAFAEVEADGSALSAA